MNVQRKISLLPVLLIIILLSSVWLAVTCYGESSLGVKSPNGGETYKAGSTVNITWSSSGINGKIVIMLYKKGIMHSVIAEQTENTGDFKWKISPTLPDGNNYRIRIRSLNDLSINDFSDADFSITR